MAERPLVAVPARFSASASALRYRADVAATALLEAVYEAGGEPLVFHPVRGADIRERLAWADAVLLPGGGDLAAHWSGQDAHVAQYDVDEVQDAVDLAIARVARHDGIAMLAVCRGLQVVNVALGGDLVQDLTETAGHDHRHLVHDIRSDFFAGPLTVSCHHHQGLGRLGAGLRPVAWAADGTIEAAVLDDAPGWFLGVQWHPEDTASSAGQAAIMRAFVEAAGDGPAPTRRTGRPSRSRSRSPAGWPSSPSAAGWTGRPRPGTRPR